MYLFSFPNRVQIYFPNLKVIRIFKNPTNFLSLVEKDSKDRGRMEKKLQILIFYSIKS